MRVGDPLHGAPAVERYVGRVPVIVPLREVAQSSSIAVITPSHPPGLRSPSISRKSLAGLSKCSAVSVHTMKS